MQEDEARAAAEAEGLELIESSRGPQIFKGVRQKRSGSRWMASYNAPRTGAISHLGTFDTQWEAALVYARYKAAKLEEERAAEEAAVARGEMRAKPLTAEEARAAAAAEGLELIVSKNMHGYKNVFTANGQTRPFRCAVTHGTKCTLGSFATAEEAALNYARHIGPERAAALAAEARGEGLPQAMTAEEVRAAAMAEGLELVGSTGATGFKGVTFSKIYSNRSHPRTPLVKCYTAKVMERGAGGKMVYAKVFATAEEAALAYARYIGPERSAAEAATARLLSRTGNAAATPSESEERQRQEKDKEQRAKRAAEKKRRRKEEKEARAAKAAKDAERHAKRAAAEERRRKKEKEERAAAKERAEADERAREEAEEKAAKDAERQAKRAAETKRRRKKEKEERAAAKERAEVQRTLAERRRVAEAEAAERRESQPAAEAEAAQAKTSKKRKLLIAPEDLALMMSESGVTQWSWG